MQMRLLSVFALSQCIAVAHVTALGSIGATSTTTTRNKLRSKYNWTRPVTWNRSVSAKELEVDLQEALAGVFGRAHSSMEAELQSVEEALRPTFQALPKNKNGNLNDRAASYLAHRYFMTSYGWHISGLGVEHIFNHNVTTVRTATVLQEKVPAIVESLLEAREAGQGLTLSDVAVMVVTLHRLIFSDNDSLLQVAYQFNDFDIESMIDELNLQSTLLSFSVIRTRGFTGTDWEARQMHRQQKAKPWPAIVFFTTLATDVAKSIAYRRRHRTNPFVPMQWSFHSLLESVEAALERFGPWQDIECHTMKEHLMSLDPLSSGRVGLAAFYDQNTTANYRFSESHEFLEEIGALDVSGGDGPKVIVSNYVLGKANCYSTSTYYTYCCLSECDGLMHEVESKIQMSKADPGEILSLAGNFSTTTVEGPQEISQTMVDKLYTIAGLHDGKVPLHGRLFAQWLHFMFPHECPYPHSGQKKDAVAASQWMGSASSQVVSESGAKAVEPSFSQWCDEEVLPLLDEAHEQSLLSFVLRLVAMAATVMAVCRSLQAMCQARAQCSHEGKKHVV